MKSKHQINRSLFLVVATLFTSFSGAADLDLVSVGNGKALLMVDGKSPKMFQVGSMITPDTKLVAVEGSNVTLESNGKKMVLVLGRTPSRTTSGTNTLSVTLQAAENGQYYTFGQLNNGSPVRMIVDTGATFVSISREDAERLGINYKLGQRGYTRTANGTAPTYLVKLDSVKVGGVEIFQVEASVHEQGLPIVLLGMSFLKRVSMVREGQQMTLSKK